VTCTDWPETDFVDLKRNFVLSDDKTLRIVTSVLSCPSTLSAGIMKHIFLTITCICLLATVSLVANALAEPVAVTKTSASVNTPNSSTPSAPISSQPGFTVRFSRSHTNLPPASPVPLNPIARSKPTWKNIKSWGLQTAVMPATLEKIGHANIDLGIISRLAAHGRPYSKSEITRAKRNKWLLAYVDVGEAQKHEWYYDELFLNGSPVWSLERNRRHPGNVRVLLDAPEWNAIILETINRVIEAGFDGVELDVLDVYWNKVYPGGSSKANQAKAVKLACKIAKFARARVPGFKIVVNNASDLAGKFPEYKTCVDATIGESVWWFNTATRRDKQYTQFQLKYLAQNQKAGLKVLVMDKTVIPKDGAFVYRESKKRGWLPFVSDWYLSSFPLEPQTEATSFGFSLQARKPCTEKDSRKCPLGSEP
jgi:cysteinyl-tRNA synthetase, unknown class